MALTRETVRGLADRWFAGLNDHMPLVKMLPMLAESFELVFPEATLTTLEEFEAWYTTVGQAFFDADHILKAFDVTLNEDGTEAQVRLTVNWIARERKGFAAHSTPIDMIAEQSWIVRQSAAGAPVIARYRVDSLVPTAT